MGLFDSIGSVLSSGVSKNGWLTNFTQDYVPLGGFFTAPIHALAGNTAYAQMAAVKGASTTISTAGAVAGTMVGGPAGGIMGAGLGSAAGTAFEGAMKPLIANSVSGHLGNLSPQDIGTSFVTGAGSAAIFAGGGKLASGALNTVRGGVTRELEQQVLANTEKTFFQQFAGKYPGKIIRGAAYELDPTGIASTLRLQKSAKYSGGGMPQGGVYQAGPAPAGIPSPSGRGTSGSSSGSGIPQWVKNTAGGVALAGVVGGAVPVVNHMLNPAQQGGNPQTQTQTAPAPPVLHGALAVKFGPRNAIVKSGVSSDEPTENAAQTAALSQCGPNCQIEINFSGQGCAAYVQSRRAWGLGQGKDEKEAVAEAVKDCGTNCKPVKTVCNSTVDLAGGAPRRGGHRSQRR